jgi:hypothetical protein
VQNTTITPASASTSHALTTTITTTSNHTNASGTTQVLPKLEIPASTTIQIQSSNQSLANAAQVCIDTMPLSDVDVRTLTIVFPSCFSYFSFCVVADILIIHYHSFIILFFFLPGS